MYKIIEHRDLNRLESSWRQLNENNPYLLPFQTFEFNESMFAYSKFGLRRIGLKARFFEVVNDNLDTEFIIPLYIKKSKGSYKAFLFGDFSPASYTDIIYSDDSNFEELECIFKLISSKLGKTEFIFNKVNERSKLSSSLRALVKETDTRPCVEIPVEDTYEKYFSRLSKSTRQTIRSSKNKLKRDGMDFRVDVYDRRKIEAGVFDSCMKIYNKRKISKADRYLMSRLVAYAKTRFNPVTQTIRTGDNNFIAILYINNQIASFCGGLSIKSSRITIPYLSMNSKYSKYSPGGLLITEIMRYLIEESNYRFFDLGRGDEIYKYRYGGKRHDNCTYQFTLFDDEEIL